MKHRRNRNTARKQRGGVCSCVMQQQQRSQKQQGGFAVALMNQFTTAASILTPIAVALGIKAYRDTKKGKGMRGGSKSKKTRRVR